MDKGVENSSNAVTQPQGDPAPVFISYASQDTHTANHICQSLESHGVPCWIAPRDVKPGAQYADAIVRAINEAKAVVLVLSASAVASAHVAREVERAASKRKPIIPFRLDSAALNPELEYFLSNSQWIEVPKLGIAAALAKLKEAGRASTSLSQALPVVAAISDKSIAVLPFADMSEKKDQEYFADGMAEEIINLLVKIPGLKIIGRTSSFQFKGQFQDLRGIGAQLGVTYILQGSVRKSGDRLRVTAQLIDSRDGAHLWSQTYERDLNDVLNMQDEIAMAIVRAMQIEVVGFVIASRPALRNTEAYTQYLQGFHNFGRFDRQGLEQALSDFQRSLELDPAFAPAAHMQGAACALLGLWGFLAPAIAFERARDAQEHALKLDPTLAIAHAVLGLVHCADWDWASADRDFQQALSLGPREAVVLFLAADNCRIMGRWDEALKLVNRSLALDPLSPNGNSALAAIQVHRGRLQEAEAAARRTLASSPAFTFAHSNLGVVLLARGEAGAALVEMLHEEDGARRLGGSAMAYFALGRRPESDSALGQLKRDHGDQSPFQVARVCAFRGELDEAFNWLERAYAQKDVNLQFIVSDPTIETIEGDLRYKVLLKKMNWPEG